MTNQEITFGIAESLANQIVAAGRAANTEQDLLIAVEGALGPVLDQLNIPKEVRYEKMLLSGRADAVYGSVVIEYESPGKLATVPGLNEAYGQARQYMRAMAERWSPGDPQESLTRLAGVVLDGSQIGFVLWRTAGEPDADVFDLTESETQLSLDEELDLAGHFQQLGPFPVNANSITDLLRFLRALSRRPLEADSLAAEFGPDSNTARAVVRALDSALQSPESPRTEVLFAEWKRLFGAIYGDEDDIGPARVRELAAAYGVEDDDIGRMLFSVHTYFALIMKILAVELVALQSGAIIEPLVAGLSGVGDDEFDQRFRELESGETFRAKGIENFLEGDFLGWYTDEWTSDLREAVRNLARDLQDFEPGTSSLRPELTQDLLKDLYHHLLPRTLRHALGEYYTPDWLAEFTMDRSGYEPSPGIRLLDPACGSGTFLVSAIKRMKAEAAERGLNARETATAITNGIVGFDLNPLAVIAARTNYLLAAGDLVGELAPFRIPVWICDSITGPHLAAETGELEGIRLPTSVGDFVLPSIAATPETLPQTMSHLEFYVENEFTGEEFLQRMESVIPDATAEDLSTLNNLFGKVARLHAEGRNGIWPRLISNAFAPLFARGQFDHVIGNPPWISWEEVSQEYRDQTYNLWVDYGLFTLGGAAARLGGGKKDISMLMTNVAAEEYLKPNGRLTFLITQTVLQTHGAGDGFRQFSTGRTRFAVESVDDMVSFNPFPGVSNWTALISLTRDRPTLYPVDYTLWNCLPGTSPRNAKTLGEAMGVLESVDVKAAPVRRDLPSSPWLIGSERAISSADSLSGESGFTASAGITTWLDGVFQVEMLGERADGMIRIRNLADVGRIQVPTIEAAIEPDLLFPFVPWANVERWRATPDRYLLVPQDPSTRAPYHVEEMRQRWPETYAYLRTFEDRLRRRSGYRRYFNPTDPFYAIYNVSHSTFSSSKVTWRTMGTEMRASVLEPTALGDMSDKPTVFKNTVIYVDASGDDEANYLAALLNSTWANYMLRASNVRGGRSSFATNLLRAIKIPAFSTRRGASRELSRLGAIAAEQAKSGDSTELELTEVLIDEAAADFWRLSQRQQAAIRESLAFLG